MSGFLFCGKTKRWLNSGATAFYFSKYTCTALRPRRAFCASLQCEDWFQCEALKHLLTQRPLTSNVLGIHEALCVQ